MIIPLIIFLVSTLSNPAPALTQGAVLFEAHADTAAYVETYYAETPILADIAWCESRLRHWNPDGTLFRGKTNDSDIGVMQINELYHAKEAEVRGMNIYGLAGNLAYAAYLYREEGLLPWASSKACWSSMPDRS